MLWWFQVQSRATRLYICLAYSNSTINHQDIFIVCTASVVITQMWCVRVSQLCSTLTPWTVACQAPLSMDFSWTVLNCPWTFTEYWSGLPFPTPGSLSQPRDRTCFLCLLPIPPKMPLPSRLPHNVEQSSLCYTVGPFWLSILYLTVCTYGSQLSRI